MIHSYHRQSPNTYISEGLYYEQLVLILTRYYLSRMTERLTDAPRNPLSNQIHAQSNKWYLNKYSMLVSVVKSRVLSFFTKVWRFERISKQFNFWWLFFRSHKQTCPTADEYYQTHRFERISKHHPRSTQVFFCFFFFRFCAVFTTTFNSMFYSTIVTKLTIHSRNSFHDWNIPACASIISVGGICSSSFTLADMYCRSNAFNSSFWCLTELISCESCHRSDNVSLYFSIAK